MITLPLVNPVIHCSCKSEDNSLMNEVISGLSRYNF